jgi:SRSO17 transposase
MALRTRNSRQAHYDDALEGQVWTRGLLIRREIADGDLAFFTTWAPRATSIERLAKIEGRRPAIEDAFETGGS